MRWVIIVVAAFFILHLWAAGAVPLGPDETYYWLWSRHPSIGYYDHPPMVALWIRAGTTLFGDGALGIRSASVAGSVLVAAVIYATGRVLFDRATANRSAIWVTASLLFGVGAFLATPDTPSALFWSLTILAYAKLSTTGRGHWWLAIGLAAGLGAVSKYTDLFLGPGLILATLIDRDRRRWLATPWPYAGGLVAAAVFAPVLIWNAEHDWASFAMQFGRIPGSGFKLSSLTEFVASLIGLVNPCVAVFVVVAAATAWRGERDDRSRAIAWLLAMVFPLIAYLIFHSTHDRVQAQWPAPAYPTLALVAAAAFDRAMASRFRRALSATGAAVVPLGAAVSVATLAYAAAPQIVLPVDPAAIFRGWAGLAADAETLRRSVGATWIAPDTYETTSELTYHLAGAVPVEQFDERIRYAFEPPADVPEGPALLIAQAGTPVDRLGCFAELTPVGTLARRGIAGHVLESFDAYLASQPRRPLPARGCVP